MAPQFFRANPAAWRRPEFGAGAQMDIERAGGFWEDLFRGVGQVANAWAVSEQEKAERERQTAIANEQAERQQRDFDLRRAEAASRQGVVPGRTPIPGAAETVTTPPSSMSFGRGFIPVPGGETTRVPTAQDLYERGLGDPSGFPVVPAPDIYGEDQFVVPSLSEPHRQVREMIVGQRQMALEQTRQGGRQALEEQRQEGRRELEEIRAKNRREIAAASRALRRDSSDRLALNTMVRQYENALNDIQRGFQRWRDNINILDPRSRMSDEEKLKIYLEGDEVAESLEVFGVESYDEFQRDYTTTIDKLRQIAGTPTTPERKAAQEAGKADVQKNRQRFAEAVKARWEEQGRPGKSRQEIVQSMYQIFSDLFKSEAARQKSDRQPPGVDQFERDIFPLIQGNKG